MKYFIKQSSMFLFMSIMLCLITFSYEDQNNKFIESLKTETATDANLEKPKPFTFVPKGWVNILGPEKFCVQDNKRRKGITQGECGPEKHALWKFLSLGGKYIIVAKSKRVINDKKGLKTNGNPIISLDRHNGYNQKWLVEFIKDGAFKLKNFYSSKCLDNSASKKKGSIYIQWECKAGNPNQIFYLINPEKKATELTKLTTAQKIAMSSFKMPSGYVNFVGDTGLCVTDLGKGKKVSQKKCSTKKNSYWKFVKLGSDSYSIYSKTGQVLTNQQSIKKNGNSIIAWDNQKGNNQKWSVLPLPNGKILLRNAEAAKCVDIDGKIVEGAAHNIYECDKTKKSQMISIKSATGNPIKTTKKSKAKAGKKEKKTTKKPTPKSIFPTTSKGKGKSATKDCTCPKKKNPFALKKSKADKKKKALKKKKPAKFHAPKGWLNMIGKDKLCVISAAKGGILTQGKCGNYSDALWKISKVEKDNYVIVSKNGMALENKDGSKKSSNPIISNKKHNAPNQRWSFHNINKKDLMIENVQTKKCLDISKKAKSGNGYVQNDCLKGNDGEHFKFQTTQGLPVKTKKISTKKKAKILKKKLIKKVKDSKKKQKKEKKFKALKNKIAGKKITKKQTVKKIKKAKKVVEKKIFKLVSKGKPEKAKKLTKVLKKIKKASKKGKKAMKKVLKTHKKTIKKKKSAKQIKKATKKVKKAAKKVEKRIAKLVTKGKGDKAKKLKKTLKKMKKVVKKAAKKAVKKAKKKAAKKTDKKDGKKKDDKKGKKKDTKKNGKKKDDKKGKKKADKKDGKKKDDKKDGKKKDTKKTKKITKKKAVKKIKKAKKAIKKRIVKLVKKGKPAKAKKLKKVLKKIKKVAKKVNKKSGKKSIKKAFKKIQKVAKKAGHHIEYNTDPTQIQKKPLVLPKGYVNIIGKSGLCIANGKKPMKSSCGNKKILSWTIIPVGTNEYNLKADNGSLLTNKNGVNKNGNPIVAVKQTKVGRDLSNIWSFTKIGNGEFIISNLQTKKCLDTTNKTNEGSGYKLMICKKEKVNNNQLFSFNSVKPEYLSKKKSDPELLKLGHEWIQLVGGSKLCIKSPGEGTPLEQSKCENNDLQLWRITPLGENEFYFQNKAGFKISIRNQAKNPKGIISNKLTLSTEKFSIVSLKAGRYMLKNTSANKCLDTDGKPKESGIYTMFKCKGNDEGQIFKFRKPTTVTVVKNWINIVGPNFLCLKNSGKGNKLVQAECNDTAEMLWKFENLSGDTFSIVNKKDQSVVDLFNSKKFKGNSLVSFARNNSKSQRWNVEQLKKGKIVLKSQASGRCLDNTGKASKGSNYRLWDCSKKSKNQQFRLQFARPAPPTKVKIVYRTKSGKIVKKGKNGKNGKIVKKGKNGKTIKKDKNGKKIKKDKNGKKKKNGKKSRKDLKLKMRKNKKSGNKNKSKKNKKPKKDGKKSKKTTKDGKKSKKTTKDGKKSKKTKKDGKRTALVSAKKYTGPKKDDKKSNNKESNKKRYVLISSKDYKEAKNNAKAANKKIPKGTSIRSISLRKDRANRSSSKKDTKKK